MLVHPLFRVLVEEEVGVWYCSLTVLFRGVMSMWWEVDKGGPLQSVETGFHLIAITLTIHQAHRFLLPTHKPLFNLHMMSSVR